MVLSANGGFAAFIAVTSSRATSFFTSARGLSPMMLVSHVTALSYPAIVADLIGVRLFLLRMRPARISLSHQITCSLKVVKGPVTSLNVSTESTPQLLRCAHATYVRLRSKKLSRKIRKLSASHVDREHPSSN